MGRWSEKYKDRPIIQLCVMPVESWPGRFDVYRGDWQGELLLEEATEDQVKELFFAELIEKNWGF